jgi:hypothetical protein
MRAGLQLYAPSGLGVLEVLDGDKATVHQNSIGQVPQMVHGLQFRRIRRKKEEVDVVGNAQALSAVPAGPVQESHPFAAVVDIAALRIKSLTRRELRWVR